MVPYTSLCSWQPWGLHERSQDLAKSQTEPLAQIWPFCLKSFSQMGFQLRPNLSNNHSGFQITTVIIKITTVCHGVTSYFESELSDDDINPLTHYTSGKIAIF